MKVGIDSYSFHRFFGEHYAGLEEDPGRRMEVWDFLREAQAMGAEGVSLEACHLPSDPAFLERLRAALDEAGFARIWAWGHPDGLGSGRRPEAAEDLLKHLAVARVLGAPAMRICCGGRRTRPARWEEQRDLLLPLLRRLADAAGEQGVVLAIENHLDMLAEELAELLERVDSPWLGVCLDTANNVRLGEDALAVVRRLAPWARATHVKDVAPQPGAEGSFASWPSVPLGQGVVDADAVVRELARAGYDGLLAVEIDHLHPRFGTDEVAAVRQSLERLRQAVDRAV
ncbi:sugar phosphate isomerase/epimerase [Roseomonas gilardii subsp. gilardii]|uniref:sugar phosphate isomerase/epimerase family protein n=1 Tax=Roseomonas gilardii TaxID=257708 RepID=UPI001FFB211C|nr:sugar phosphate isomerase/epimerase family protein [Roseomonas gilardii]UPG72761.1 sugar phosphate isomerase/epimerase [Roseomonas gilardii subsp. gilardii]